MRYALCLFMFCTFVFLPSYTYPAEKEEYTFPNLLQIEPNWWEEFASDEEALMKHIPLAVKAIESVYEGIDEELKQDTSELKNRILVHLEALPALVQQKISDYAPLPYKPQYTLQDVVRMGLYMQKEAAEQEYEKKEQKLLRKRQLQLEKSVDSLIVQYLNEKEATKDRYILGMEWIAQRLALAVIKEKIRISEELTKNREQEISHLREEVAYALKNIAVFASDQKEIQRQIAKIEKALHNSQYEAIVAEVSSSGTLGDLHPDSDAAHLKKQQAINSYLQDALLKVELISLNIQELYLKIASQERPKLKKVQEEINDFYAELEDIRSIRSQWKERGEEELARLSRKPAEEESGPLQEKCYEEAEKTLKNLEDLEGYLFTTELLLGRLHQELMLTAPWWKRVFTLTFLYGKSVWEYLYNILNYTLFHAAGVPISLFSLAKALLIFAGFYGLSLFLRWVIRRFHEMHKRVTDSSVYILERVVHYATLFLGVSLACLSVGLNFNNVFILLSALSVGIGFGLQNIVNNFVSSLIILFARNIKVQDFIELGGENWGQVIAIDVQNTIIRNLDGTEIVVPNSQLISSKVSNWTMHNPYKRLHIPFRVPAEMDKEAVEKAALKAAKSVSATVFGETEVEDPSVWLVNFGKDFLDFELVVWINVFHQKARHGSLLATYKWELHNQLQKIS